MARSVRKSGVKEVPLSKVKDELSRYLREAEDEPVVITRHVDPPAAELGGGLTSGEGCVLDGPTGGC